MGNHIKREHKEREELNSSGLWAQLVSCFCQDCSLVGSCSTYDDHGEENHNIPKNQGKMRRKKLKLQREQTEIVVVE